MGTGDGTESTLLRSLTGLQDNASLAGFLQIAFDAVVIFDSRERIISWNPAAERMFGWILEEALGKTPAELFWPLDMPLGQEYKNQRQARLKRGETLQGILTPCRKDGSSFPAQYTARAIFNSEGKADGYLAVYRDLSAQTQALEKEKQLQEVNRRLNLILTSIQDDFYVLSRDWVFLFASRTFTSRIGKEPEDFAGKNIWEMFPAHVGTAFEENLRAAMEKREIRRFEIPGRYTDAWYRMAAFPSEEGITVLGTDITELKKAERARHSSEQRLQRVLETDAVGVLFFDSDGYVIDANDVFLKMTGYTRDQIERRELHWRIMTPPEWIAESEAQMERFTQTGRIGPYEKEYFLADGSRRWMLFAGRAVGDGTISEYCIDISDRKQTEAALRQSQRTFQELIERAPFGVYVVDSQFRIAHMNASSQTGAFRNVQPIIGRDFAEAMHTLWPEEIASGIISAFRHTLETGEPYYSPRFTNLRQDVDVVESYEWELQRMTLPDGQYGVICYYYDSTKLLDAESAARESEERFSRAFYSSPVAINIFSPVDGRAIDINEAFLDLTGYTRDEIIGHTGIEMNVFVNLTERQAMLQKLEELGAVRNQEIQIRHKSGKILDTLFSVVIIDRQGQPRALALAIDITARKRAENALRENQAMLQSFYDSAPFMMGTVELDGDRSVLVSGNQALADFFASRPENMRGHASSELGTPIDIERMWVEQYRKSQSLGTPLRFEYEYPRPGSGRWFHATVSFIEDGPPGKPRFSFVTEEVTKRRQAEDIVRQQAQLLNLSGEAIFVWELYGVIRYWNTGAENLYGYSKEEAVGRVSHELLATQHPLNEKAFLVLLEEKSEWRGELAHRTRDGRTVYVESTQQLVNQGGQRLVLETNRDITERKQAEHALLEKDKQLLLLNENLEQKVQEKTEEVRHLASDLTVAVQRERHRISHILHDDLQQRIYAIQMQLTFLRYELMQESEAARNELTDIEKELLQILEIARHLSIDLSPPILQNEGLSQAISWLAGQMRQRYGLSIELQADGPFTVPGEELHVLLFNCVRELLFNVVKHSGARQAVVKLDWVKGGLRIEVHDKGQGFQIHPSREQASGEENLPQSFGLPTIRKQLSLFGGQMEVHSQPGAGTQAVLFVPIAEHG